MEEEEKKTTPILLRTAQMEKFFFVIHRLSISLQKSFDITLFATNNDTAHLGTNAGCCRTSPPKRQTL